MLYFEMLYNFDIQNKNRSYIFFYCFYFSLGIITILIISGSGGSGISNITENTAGNTHNNN